jgi:hypothetical protein
MTPTRCHCLNQSYWRWMTQSRTRRPTLTRWRWRYQNRKRWMTRCRSKNPKKTPAFVGRGGGGAAMDSSGTKKQ